MNSKQETITALDLGNSMTRAIIAEVPGGSPVGLNDAALPLRFLGYGEVRSRGWHKGSLSDIDLAAASVRGALEKAEQMAGGVVVESAILGTGGPHLSGLSSRAGIRLAPSFPREIRREDLHQVMQDARNIPLAADREIIHLVPKEFVLDSHEGIRNPVGMQGLNLEVSAHVLTGSVSTGRNLVSAVNRAGILVETVAGEAYVTGEATASDEERETGVLVVVMGSASCELVAFRNDGLAMAGIIPLGGDHFTGDLSIGLQTSRADAEKIKCTFGSVTAGWSHKGSTVEVPGVGEQPARLFPHRFLREILEARASELFILLGRELERCGLGGELQAGLVLTGGGARLPGLCDLAERILHLPARIGLPSRIVGMHEILDAPDKAPLLGLLQYGMRVRRFRSPHGKAPSSPWKHLFDRKR